MTRSKLLTRLLSTTATTGLFFSTFATRAAAQTQEWSSQNPNCVYKSGELDVATLIGVECMVFNVLQVAVSLIGFTAFVMLLVGAFLYLTSGGNQKGISAAKQTFTYAVLGIVVAVMSWFGLNLIAQFTGITRLLEFQIYFGG